MAIPGQDLVNTEHLRLLPNRRRGGKDLNSDPNNLSRLRLQHREFHPVRLERRPRLRDAAEAGGEKSADGFVSRILRDGQAEAAIQFRHGQSRIGFGDLRAEAAKQRRIAGFVFVPDFADQFFQHVLDGDQPGRAAVFIQHDRDVNALVLKIVQKIAQRLGLRDEHRRADGASGTSRCGRNT